jgi:cytochrome c peroxidase
MIAPVLLQLAIPLGLDAFLPTPETNPVTREKAALGKRLFFDKALSRDRTVSCATCHLPERAFTDDKPVAVGIAGRKGKRRTPTILNRAYGKSFFWDGRAATLEEQVLLPIQSPEEMDMTIPETLARLNIDAATLSQALATYVRTILAGDSPYDRYLNGDRTALTPQQAAGLRLFRGKANCSSCHIGTNLTDEQFHNTALPNSGDEGKANRAFKTPTLRDAARRAPYMHDGSLATLEDVIEHYDKGGEEDPLADPEIRPLKLTPGEKRDLRAFLDALSGTVKDGIE